MIQQEKLPIVWWAKAIIFFCVIAAGVGLVCALANAIPPRNHDAISIGAAVLLGAMVGALTAYAIAPLAPAARRWSRWRMWRERRHALRELRRGADRPMPLLLPKR